MVLGPTTVPGGGSQKKSKPATSGSVFATQSSLSSVSPIPSELWVGGAGATRSILVAHDDPPWFSVPEISMKKRVTGCAALVVPACGVQSAGVPMLDMKSGGFFMAAMSCTRMGIV
jgi:hypothetical protein